jgi:hypothetical protein
MNRRDTYIRPLGKPIRTPLWKRVARWVLYVTSVTAISVLGAVILIEWMAGCGETYTDAKGEQHANECIFIRVN